MAAPVGLYPTHRQGRRSGFASAGGAAAVAAFLALLLSSGVSGALGGDPLTTPARPADGARYVVQPGDTVWSIAAEVAPSGDVRPVVDAIVAARGTSPLQPGETIVLP